MRWHQCLHPCVSRVLEESGVAIRTDFNGTKGDHGAVDFVDGTIDLLHIIRVRDDLVIGDNVLMKISAIAIPHNSYSRLVLWVLKPEVGSGVFWDLQTEY
jgi:hypothetical protein